MSCEWPPEFDGIKIETNKLLARVKDTDIWLELDLQDPFWVKYVKGSDELTPLLAWSNDFQIKD